MDWKAEIQKLEKQLSELKSKYSQKIDAKTLEEIRVKFLGKKGPIKALFDYLKKAPQEERPLLGKSLNRLKRLYEDWIKETRCRLKDKEQEILDPTIPSGGYPLGAGHIISQTIEEIVTIFQQMGFAVATGPEVEREYYNFTALNIDVSHPSRDAFDTFYIDASYNQGDNRGRYLLRSHTSPMQIRIMERFSPPIAAVVPGRVYRPDAVDASHSFMFHQIEGFLVDEDVKFSHLKGVLVEFAKKFFYEDIELRFRPHYFPFTEPSAEVDISCLLCKGKGCPACKRTGWVEVLGCGMIHPNVFSFLPDDYKGYRGFAFGMGVERMCMLKYGIPDIRLFYSNDIRFLCQFR